MIREWRGPAAALRWGYRTAADLAEWSIVADRGDADAPGAVTWRLAARVVRADPYALRQAPLELLVPRGDRAALRWPVVRAAVAGGRLVAEVGARVKGD